MKVDGHSSRNEWQLYRSQANLPDSSPAELRACCTKDLRLALFEFIGPALDTYNESDLLDKLRMIIVNGKNVAVHRQEFYAMHQDAGQSAQQFLAKLKAKAEHCNFQIKCSSNNCGNNMNSYASAIDC